MKTKLLEDGEPCGGCVKHADDACTWCGRTMARGQSIIIADDRWFITGDYMIVPNGYNADALQQHVELLISDSPSKLLN